ncbi:MAG: hypothetical protein ACYDA0_02895 [Candidatus Dormibacteraceae bacterium]
MSWEPGVSAERRARPRRRLRPADERALLRRLTIAAAVAAVGLNAALFLQTWFSQMGTGEVQDAIVSAVGGLFPGSGLQPPSQLPSPSPGGGVATSGGS